MTPNLKTVFDKSRQELLDMGLRGNTLLSLGKGAKVLDIVDEKSEQVFDTLVNQAKEMKFLPAPSELDSEDQQSLSLQDLTLHLEEKVGDKRHDDNALQTQLFQRVLETRLLKLSSEAILFVQEQGVDLLYLATGFLKWFEDTNSSKPRYAPLVLIPVEIYRGDAGDAFKIRYTDAELGSNLTLAAKLKMEFGIILPEFIESDEGYDLKDYFDQVELAISAESKWSVDKDKVALSFFSFGKFQMYQDLSDEAWPEDQKPSENPVIRKLFSEGFESDANKLDSSPMDVNRVEEIQLILDSDSSQTEAVLAAKSGVNLVIQGPPGTGKSQTITNIISQALADNKKVLFVAEKMAALDVVKRRLDNCHIGDAVLELHSHKANKKAVLSSLESTLLQHAPVVPERSEDIDRLVSLRNKLDDYCAAVNEPIADTGVSYQKALGFATKYEVKLQAAELDLDKLPKVITDLTLWNSTLFNNAVGKLQELADYLQAHQAPSLNLYGTTQLSEFSPANFKEAQKYVLELTSLQNDFIEQVKSLALQLSFSSVIVTLNDAKNALGSLRLLAGKPQINGLNVDASTWQEKGDGIVQFATQGIELQNSKAQLNSQFLEQALEFDWVATRGVLANTGKKWWRILSSDYRKAKTTFAGMRRSELAGSASEWVDEIDNVLNYKSQQTQFTDLAQDLITVIGEHYKNDNTDWQSMFEPLQWVYQARKGLAEDNLDTGIEKYLNGEDAGIETSDIQALDLTLEKLTNLANKVCSLLDLHSDTFLDRIENLGLAASTSDNTLQIDNDFQKMYELTRFNRLSAQLAEYQMGEWGEVAGYWESESSLLLDGFKWRFFNSLVNDYYEYSPEVRYFDRVEHENMIEQFTTIDSQLFNFTQESLVKQLFDNLPNPTARGEVETLRREFNKKRRQMPIRRLLNKSGRAIQQLKPIFMMSPMSIATYLDPGVLDFDLVVFDEASQVKVADALGAILRGKQVIVVGDTKQMPPTNFFGKQFVADDEEADESLTADMESILGMFLASGTPERMLKWHYRSRHESLIAVSNQEFYDNKLMIFPSSGINPHAKGLSFKHLSNTTYDRGGSRSNHGEATAVAEAVMKHARETPDQTLGVVAFSTAQRDTILLEVERLRKLNPDLEFFFGEHAEGEDFFVKNLENVQGDERDTIYISIGYGKTTEGRLPMSFGPLNGEGGERRLNVLISRARMCMNVFCNFKANEMPTTAESPFGVRALKNFLQYAEKKQLVRSEETGKEPDSPFEEEVISAIRGLGYEVQPQVGCAGFYIDIAVRDQAKQGRYMLAVECDGATYHSSKSARDRDRIRQSVLEGLGWRFHRIWSTDWFRNRHVETSRLHDALKSAAAYYKNFDEKSDVEIQPQGKKAAEIARIEVENKTSSADYLSAKLEDLKLSLGDSIPDVDTRALASDIENIIKVESPIHVKQLGIRLLSAVGAARSGARINRAITDAISHLVRQGIVVTEGEFVLYKDMEIKVRNRLCLAANERKFDLIYNGEIEMSACEVVKDTYSISEDDLVKSIAETLGFSATSKAMKIKIQGVLNQLIETERLLLKGDSFQVS